MATLFDRLLGRKPPTTGKPRSDSGRGHTQGFLDLEELNNDLRGRQGLDTYDKMYRGDPDVHRNVVMAYTPIVNATWSVDPHGGEDASEEDQQIADDLAWALGIGDYWADTPLATPLSAHLAEFMPVFMRSGFTSGEVVWGSATRTVTKPKPQDPAEASQNPSNGKPGVKDEDPKQLADPAAAGEDQNPSGQDQNPVAPVEMVTETRDLLTFRKFVLHVPRSIHRWILDDNGELVQLEQFSRTTGDMVPLPRQDLLYYRVGAEGDNWEGVSMLRPVYKPWYIKDKVERLDAMGQEREAIGLPVVYPPQGMNSDDGRLTDLEDKLAKLRAGELAYLIMPGPSAEHVGAEGWHFNIEGLAGGGQSGGRDAQSTLNYHRDGISAAFIAEFMRLGQGSTSTGAKATGDVQDDPFLAAVQALADVPRLELNKVLVRRWVTLNYGPEKPCPTINVGFTDDDIEQLRDYVANLVSAGALNVDDDLEDHLRKRGKLPPADPEAREQRKQQEEESRQAELEAVRNPDPTGEDGDEHHEAVTETRKPDGTKSVKREKTKRSTRARTLEDGDIDVALAGTHDAAALQITPEIPKARGHRCECDRKDCPCDGGPGCTYETKHTLAEGELRDWERLMPLQDLAQALDDAKDRIAAAVSPHVATLALAAASGSDEPSSAREITAAIASELDRLYRLGGASVRRELEAQRTGRTAVLDATDLSPIILADDQRAKLIAAAGLAARAIVTTIWTTVQRRLLNGAPEATAIAAGEDAGRSHARVQATQAGPGALAQGRGDASHDLRHLIKGARYTSILDANRCDVCAKADDGILRTLDDPIRLAHRPPNPDCEGWDKCRCLEFYELDDEAPAYLDEAVDAGRLRDGQGRFVEERAMVALYPSAELAERVALEGGEPADGLHVTLAYLGLGRDLRDQQTLMRAVAGWAASTPPLAGSLGGAALFTSDENTVTYLQVNINGLTGSRALLATMLDGAGMPPSTTHDFVAHLTLAYTDRTQDVETLDEPVTFDEVAVVIGGRRRTFKLTGV